MIKSSVNFARFAEKNYYLHFLNIALKVIKFASWNLISLGFGSGEEFSITDTVFSLIKTLVVLSPLNVSSTIFCVVVSGTGVGIQKMDSWDYNPASL